MNDSRYITLERLASSEAYDVFDAWSVERDCRVVLKVPKAARRDDPPTKRRLLAEGRLLQRLTHPHIVRAYEVHESPAPMVVLETLAGATLAHVIDDGGGPLDANEAALLGLQVGSALRYLHGMGVLHLDLKPSNIVVENGRAKLIDLSIARAPGRDRPGLGTWCYMAPEQEVGAHLTTATDVWGLGATLCEALTGEIPFEDGRGTPPVRGPLGPLVAACLQPAPADRPTLVALVDALNESRSGRGLRPRAPGWHSRGDAPGGLLAAH